MEGGALKGMEGLALKGMSGLALKGMEGGALKGMGGGALKGMEGGALKGISGALFDFTGGGSGPLMALRMPVFGNGGTGVFGGGNGGAISPKFCVL